jgi:hypothetical protein
MPDSKGKMIDFTVGEFAKALTEDGQGNNAGYAVRWTKIAEGDWEGESYERAQPKKPVLVTVEFLAGSGGRADVKAIRFGDISAKGEVLKQSFQGYADAIAMWQRRQLNEQRWAKMNKSAQPGETIWQDEAETLSYTAKPPQYYEVTYDFRSRHLRKVLGDANDLPKALERQLTGREHGDLVLFLKTLRLQKMVNQPMPPPGGVWWCDLKIKNETRRLARRGVGSYWQLSDEQATELKALFVDLISDTQWAQPAKKK